MAALLVLAASVAAAQVNLPPGKWWRRPEVIQILNLSEEQQDRLESVFVASAGDLIDLRAEVEKQAIALRAAIDQAQLDRNVIRNAAERLNIARGRQFQRELLMLVDMRAVLSDAQWNRMRNELDRLNPKQQRLQQQNPLMRPRPRPR